MEKMSQSICQQTFFEHLLWVKHHSSCENTVGNKINVTLALMGLAVVELWLIKNISCNKELLKLYRQNLSIWFYPWYI